MVIPCGTKSKRPGLRRKYPQPLLFMGHLFLAIFLVVFGLNLLLGVVIPSWILGVLALVAGILLLMERFRTTPRP